MKKDPEILFEKALAHDPYNDLASVLEQIQLGNIKAWIGTNSFLLTEVVNYPKCKALQVCLAGGDLVEIIEEIRPKVEVWAKNEGCTNIFIEGRKGWKRELALEGYKEVTTTIMKEL